MSVSMKGSVAVVTGASSGIGEATARALAASGATVAVVARRAERLDDLVAGIEADGGSAFAVAADVTDQAQCEAAVDTVLDTAGRLDILVNNAGLMRVGPFDGGVLQEWEDMIAVNQKGMLYMTRAALPHLKKAAQDELRGVADIVNISSEAGRVASKNYNVYNMTKFGVNGFSESLRQELAPAKIRVGVLEPGAVDTELNDHSTGHDGSRDDVRAQIDAVFARIRALQGADIADGVEYMVTRPAHTAVGELWIMPTDQG